MLKSLATSWKTTACGVLAALCATSSLLELMPPQWSGAAQGFCMILVSLGVIAAKDANVSHSEQPADPQKVG